MKLKKKKLNRIEGIGLLLILISFFVQLIQNDLQGSLNESQYYHLHVKLDAMWRVIENDYSQNHPEQGVSGVINFKSYSDDWKIYSEQVKELKSWEDSITLFTRINIGLFILGSILLIVPKFIDEKE